jgi:hypothetical protein
VFWIVRVPHTDVAVGIDNVFVRQNAVGDDKVTQEIVKLAHIGVLTFIIGRQFGVIGRSVHNLVKFAAIRSGAAAHTG